MFHASVTFVRSSTTLCGDLIIKTRFKHPNQNSLFSDMGSLQQPKTEMKACFHLVTFINQSAKHSQSMGATVASRVVRMCWMKTPHLCLHCCIQNAMQSQSSRTKSASSVPVSVHQCRTQCATRDRSLHNETYRCVVRASVRTNTHALMIVVPVVNFLLLGW